MTFEIYKNAPITEAVLDIRTRLYDPSLDELSKIRDAAYPNSYPTPNLMLFSFSVGSGSPQVNTSSEPMGYAYRSEDEKNIFQVRKDGFTHNRLAPYTEWQSFSSEARRLWSLYKDAASPTVIEMIGLNYINEFYLPFGLPFEEYFNTYVEVPKELPQNLVGFSFSYQLLIPGDAGLMQIAQGYGPMKRPDHSTVILNIQTSKQINQAIRDITEDELWAKFESLRFAKSEAFEACITDKVRGIIR
jgi:uncharacterized protein (TIGR04255 family)